MDKAFKMCEKHGARVLGVEDAGSGEYITWPWQNELYRRGLTHIQFVPLKAKKGPSQYVPHGSSQHGKDARIGAALVPLYNNGLIYHNKAHPLTKTLEMQLLGFPRAKSKDLIDSLAYVTGLMHEGERFFATNSFSDMYSLGPNGGLNTKAEDMALSKILENELPAASDWQV